MHTALRWGNQKEKKTTWEDLGVDGKIMKMILINRIEMERGGLN